MKDSHYFIVNCASNAARAETLFRSQMGSLKSHFPDSEFIFVEKEDSIKVIASKAAEKHSIVVACGGDGTVNKVANGILDTGAILGVLPAGSGNDFAKSVGLGRDFEENVNILKERKTTRIDVIDSGDEVFLNTLGIGLDGLTNYYASKLPFKRGYIRYFFGGLTALLTSTPFQVTYNHQNKQHKKEVWMAVIANGKIEGGKYLISPGSKNNDGVFEVILVNKIYRAQLLLEFIKLSMGFSFKDKVVEKLTATEFSLSASEIKEIHSDGERLPASNQFHFRLKEKALPVIVNSTLLN